MGTGDKTVNADVAGILEVGIAERGLEEPSGDTFVAAPYDGGVLVAVVDGIGHGPEAALAANAARDALSLRPEVTLSVALSECHRALRKTRGAVMSLASVRAGVMTWVGVGNVEGALIPRLRSARTRLLAARGGVVGQSLPQLYAAELPIDTGDVLVLATDGISRSTLTVVDHLSSAQANADRMLAEGSTGTDDALVLVARYRGLGT